MKPSGSETNWDLSPRCSSRWRTSRDRLVYVGGLENTAGLNPSARQARRLLQDDPHRGGPDRERQDLVDLDRPARRQRDRQRDGVPEPVCRGSTATSAASRRPATSRSSRRRPTPPSSSNRLFADLELDDGELDKLKSDRGSVLDAVQDNLEAVKNKVSTADRIKIRAAPSRPSTRSSRTIADIGQLPGQVHDPRRPRRLGTTGRNPAVAQAHMDVLASAFACDLTRVAVLNWGEPTTGSISVSPGSTWAGTSAPTRARAPASPRPPELTTASIWKMGQLAYLLQKLDEYQDDEGSVLDNTPRGRPALPARLA